MSHISPLLAALNKKASYAEEQPDDLYDDDVKLPMYPSETFGWGFTAPAVAAGLGAAAGGALGNWEKDYVTGGALAGLLGGILANIIGAHIGDAKGKRSKEERKEYADSNLAAVTNLLVPGMGAYNVARTDHDNIDILRNTPREIFRIYNYEA